MRTPEFWYRARGGVAGALLAPLGRLYGLGVPIRFALARPWRAGVPVICIGNLVAGGAGKTPVALAVGALLTAMGIAHHFLTRGHGGSLSGPVRVDAAEHDFTQVGDEALLLAAQAPTWVAADRPAGARAASAAGAQMIVMDDGFQNPSLVKDLSLLVIDGQSGFGNGRLIPAGPLRESVSRGLGRAHGVVLMGADATGLGARLPTVLNARLVPGAEAEDLKGRRVLAFAGMGRPGKFFQTLSDIGCEVVEAHAFSDHFAYDARTLDRLADRGRKLDAALVTTAKDAQRLGGRAEVRVLNVSVEWGDARALEGMLGNLLTDGP